MPVIIGSGSSPRYYFGKPEYFYNVQIYYQRAASDGSFPDAEDGDDPVAGYTLGDPKGIYTFLPFEATDRDLRIKFKVILPQPWRAAWGTSITIPYRIVTYMHTGTKTSYGSGDDAPPPTYEETASASYEESSVTIDDMEAGDTEGVSDSFDVETLSEGGDDDDVDDGGSTETRALNYKGVIGPAETKYLVPAFGVRTFGQARRKFGFSPYARTWEGRTAAVACYSTETASNASPPSGVSYPSYSGLQSVTPLDPIIAGDPPTAHYTRTFSSNVLAQYVSPQSGTVDGGNFGSGPADAIAPELVSRSAVQVSDTRIQWPNGLVLELSGLVSTASIVGPVETLIAGHTWSSDDGDFLVDRPMVAERYLPANELSFRAHKGRYRIHAGFTFFTGIGSFWAGQPAPYTPTDLTLEVSWSENTHALDTGESGAPSALTETLDYSFVDDDHDGYIDPGHLGIGEWHEVAVPTGNAYVRLDDLEITTDSRDSLRQSFVGYIDDGES